MNPRVKVFLSFLVVQDRFSTSLQLRGAHVSRRENRSTSDFGPISIVSAALFAME